MFYWRRAISIIGDCAYIRDNTVVSRVHYVLLIVVVRSAVRLPSRYTMQHDKFRDLAQIRNFLQIIPRIPGNGSASFRTFRRIFCYFLLAQGFESFFPQIPAGPTVGTA